MNKFDALHLRIIDDNALDLITHGWLIFNLFKSMEQREKTSLETQVMHGACDAHVEVGTWEWVFWLG